VRGGALNGCGQRMETLSANFDMFIVMDPLTVMLKGQETNMTASRSNHAVVEHDSAHQRTSAPARLFRGRRAVTASA
jgi:hypothetical protein